MNHREPPHLPAGVRRALHCLSLMLLPALTPEGVHALPRSRLPGNGPNLRNAEPIPYLPLVGAPPLRFQEAAPPPDLVTRPAAAAPPTPALSLTETSVALANAAAAHSTTVAPGGDPAHPSPPSPPPPPATEPLAPETQQTPAEIEAEAPEKAPAPILPDNARPAIRPEDFLPYFQIPGSARNPSDVTLLVPSVPSAPAPAPLPPSSATYTQSPQ